MQKVRDKIAFIVATKDRPDELQRMLKSLAAQFPQTGQVIIVDGSDKPIEAISNGCKDLNITYLRCSPPSAARQRNIGIRAVSPETTLIGFLDDDVVLENNAIAAMIRFWEGAPDDVGGAAFNMVNHPSLYAPWLKSLLIVEKLGLYSREKGAVLTSGFHTMIGYTLETTYTEWLSSGAIVWRRNIFDKFQFDEWFDGYSYLEDLDFSYRVSRKYRLAVVADAKYYHYQAPAGRGSNYTFGKREVANRVYFVRKNSEFSLTKCYLALIVRIFISVVLTIQEGKIGYLMRALGNIVGLVKSCKKPSKT